MALRVFLSDVGKEQQSRERIEKLWKKISIFMRTRQSRL